MGSDAHVRAFQAFYLGLGWGKYMGTHRVDDGRLMGAAYVAQSDCDHCRPWLSKSASEWPTTVVSRSCPLGHFIERPGERPYAPLWNEEDCPCCKRPDGWRVDDKCLGCGYIWPSVAPPIVNQTDPNNTPHAPIDEMKSTVDGWSDELRKEAYKYLYNRYDIRIDKCR